MQYSHTVNSADPPTKFLLSLIATQLYKIKATAPGSLKILPLTLNTPNIE